jgi:peptide/nickel transport system permease protein
VTDLQSQPIGVAADGAAAGAPPVEMSREGRSQWGMILRRFLRHKSAVLALFVLVALFLLVTFADQVSFFPNNPVLTSKVLDAKLQGPSAAHWLGTDPNGRDVLTRILHAGSVSLNVGLFVALISGGIGIAIGSVAGYFGGILDQILMRITDLFLVLPAIAVLAMAQGLQTKDLPVVGRPSAPTLMVIVLSLLFWQQMARVVRGLILSIKEKEFIEAARASGAGSARIIIRHILPNIVGPIAVNVTLVVGAAIVSESTLSFLGFGLKPPDVSWGVMLASGEDYVGTSTAYLVYFPALALLLTVLAVNFLGDGLRDAFDPQAKH